MNQITGGVYPTMITPYRNGEIDYDAVKKLVDWYIEKGCAGIFAVCQSSEMFYLSLKERIKLAETVVKQADGRAKIVASGHCGTSLDEQAEEITEISKTGIDSFVLVSNRFDLHGEGDDVWLKNAEYVLDKADFDVTLGIYECPKPYKRLLTPRILDWCIRDGRFRFIKDTCCDTDMLTQRLDQLAGSNITLFNANAQTCLYSLQRGVGGYSGIMANFHPDLYVWLCEHYKEYPEKAQELSDVLSMMAFTESLTYPCTAKHYLNLEGIEMDTFARSADDRNLTPYQKLIVQQIYDIGCRMRRNYGTN